MYTPTFLHSQPSWLITLAVVFVMMIFYRLGMQIRRLLTKRGIAGDNTGIGMLEGSILGLLALMLSFTFSLSSARYDKRIAIVVEEANDIGTALLRADLYPDSIRQILRHEFKNYIECRIEFYKAGRNIYKAYAMLDTAQLIQGRIWQVVAKAGQDKENFHRTSLMMPALNNMIDIVTTRTANTLARVPELIIYLLFMLCFTSAMMVGYYQGRKADWIITIAFSIMIALTIFMILDLDRPRGGLITLKNAHYHIEALLKNFK
jgi:hypothetical protein